MYPPNDLRMLRFNNAMNPPDALQGETMEVPQAQNVQSDNSSYYDDALKQLYENFPQKQEPGLGRKILAVINAIRTPPAHMMDVYDETKYPDYYRQLGEWKQKAGVLEKGTALQNTGLLRSIQHGQLDEKVRSDKAREADRETMRDLQQQKVDISSYNAAINEFKAKNHNAVIKDVGGKLVAINPLTNETEELKDKDGNPLETGKLDDTTKMHIQLQNKLAEIAASGGQARETEKVRQSGRTDLETQRQTGRTNLETQRVEGRVEVKKTPSSTGKGAGNLPPGQQKIAAANAAREYIRLHPEAGKFIKFTGNNEFEVTPPSTGAWYSRGPSKEEHDAAVKFIDSSISSEKANVRANVPNISRGNTGLNSGSVGSLPAEIKKPTNKVPLGGGKSDSNRVRVLSPDGTPGSVSVEDSKRLPPGWKIVTE